MTTHNLARPLRHLVLVLGDQLDPQASAFDGFDPAQDAVWMAEVAEESTHVWSSKPRIALFLAAMRHFAADLRAAGLTVHYTHLDDPANAGSLAAELQRALQRLRPAQLVMIQPGDWRVLQAIPAGQTASYAEVAQRIGSPKAVRAVAQACAANGLAVAIPCHRVVKSDGALSGYRWGVERKRALLARESDVEAAPLPAEKVA